MIGALVVSGLVGCGAAASGRRTATVRAACAADARWDGAACVSRTAAAALAASDAAQEVPDMDAALAALDRADDEPLDLASHVRLWESRGVVRAYLAAAEPTPTNEDAARVAFDRLLAIAPTHQLRCDISEQATLRFERVRATLEARAPRELEVTWPRDRKVGEPVAVDVETIADPVGVLRSATIYLRVRGATAWDATEVMLPPPGQRARVWLPAVRAQASTGVELFAVAHDRDGNDTLRWASPERPRDIPLRFDPPTPWYRTWWVWAIAGGAVAVGAGVTTYAQTWSPSGDVGGTVTTSRR